MLYDILQYGGLNAVQLKVRLAKACSTTNQPADSTISWNVAVVPRGLQYGSIGFEIPWPTPIGFRPDRNLQ